MKLYKSEYNTDFLLITLTSLTVFIISNILLVLLTVLFICV